MDCSNNLRAIENFGRQLFQRVVLQTDHIQTDQRRHRKMDRFQVVVPAHSIRRRQKHGACGRTIAAAERGASGP